MTLILRMPSRAAVAALALLCVVRPVWAADAPAATSAVAPADCPARERLWGPVGLALAGGEVRHVPLPAPVAGAVVIEVRELGIDATVRLIDAAGEAGPAAMSPTERTGTVHVALPQAAGFTLALTGRDDATRRGRLEVSAYRAAGGGAPDGCVQVPTFLAGADAAFAAGEAIERGGQMGPHRSARHYYQLAAEGYRAAYVRLPADRVAKADAADAAANVEYTGTYDFAAAARWAVDAVRLAQAIRDPYRAARAEALLAQSLVDDPGMPAPSAAVPAGPHERFEYARAMLTRLAAFHLKRGEPVDGWGRLNTLGLSYYDEAAFAEAIPVLRRAAAGFGAAGAHSLQGMALQNVGLCEWGLGELTRADDTFREATRHVRPQPFPYYYLNVITNYAMLSYVIGELDRALRLQHEALGLAEQFEAPILIGSNLYSLGNTYYALGDLGQSAYYLERARAVHSPSARSYVATLRSLAAVYRELGRRTEATAAGEAALAAATSAVARLKIGVGLAEDAAAAGRTHEAQGALDTLLSSPASRNPSIRVEVLLARARIRAATADAPGATTDLREALHLLQTVESPALAFQCHLALARLLRAGGEAQDALHEANLAITLAAQLRRQTANPELRAQKQEPLRSAYEVKVDLLMDEYRRARRAGQAGAAADAAARALAVADDSRAPTFIELVAEAPGRTDETVARRRAALYREIAARQYQLDARRDAHDADDARTLGYQREIARLRREADLLGSTAATGPDGRRGPGAGDPQAWVEWLAHRHPGTAIVSFWMGPIESYAWLVGARGIEVFELGDTAALATSADQLAERLHGFSTTSVAARREALSAMSDRLAAPLTAAARAARDLVIVPDRGLGYLPFPALSPGRNAPALVHDHDLALTPAARVFVSRATPVRDTHASGRLLIVADPIYEAGDPRRTDARTRGVVAAGGAPAYQRLPFAGREAEAISALFAPAAVVRLAGADATRERVLGEPLGSFRYLHFAVHGTADERMPALSAVILGAYDARGATGEQALRATDLLPLRLGADVVTLSACDTGRGRELAGEGIVGFGYVALARGAHAVVSSLWPVSDEISVELMTDLYRGLARGDSAPRALGDAMRGVLRRAPDLDVALWGAYQAVVADAGAASFSE